MSQMEGQMAKCKGLRAAGEDLVPELRPSGRAGALHQAAAGACSTSVAAPGIRFEVQGLDPPDHAFHTLSEFRCAGQVIRNACEAEKAGYDAFVLGHFQEPGLIESAARSTSR